MRAFIHQQTRLYDAIRHDRNFPREWVHVKFNTDDRTIEDVRILVRVEYTDQMNAILDVETRQAIEQRKMMGMPVVDGMGRVLRRPEAE